MGQQIIRQPDNNYSIWSTIVDDFIAENLTEDELLKWYKEEYGRSSLWYVERTLQMIKEGKKAYAQFTKTYEEACAWRDEVHKFHAGDV